MVVPSVVGHVLARIGRIESDFAPIRSVDTVRVQPSGDFDPFGEAYQRAVVASHAPAAAAATALPGPPVVASRLTERVTMGSTLPRTSTAWSSPSQPIAVPGTRQIGGYGSMPIPPELAAIGNGRIRADRLQPIAQSGHRLYAPAAAAWDGLVAAAASEGFELRITDSYRSYDQQVDLAERKGLYKQGGLAATPGTSNHGWGLAVDADVRDPRLLEWLRTNGPRFGFVEAVPREPWHWEYRPHQV